MVDSNITLKKEFRQQIGVAANVTELTLKTISNDE